MANLRTESLTACGTALRAYNFSKRKGVFLQPGSTPSVSGWLGLNLATWALPDMLQVNPVVGVRHVPLEKALVELAGWPPPVACLSRSLGYLMPQKTYVQWDFPAGGDLAAIAEDLAKAVAVHGQPFIDEWSGWETFSENVGPLLTENEKYIVLPLVLAINGDRAGAEQLIQQETDRVGDAPDVYSQSYREFARKFAGKTF